MGNILIPFTIGVHLQDDGQKDQNHSENTNDIHENILSTGNTTINTEEGGETKPLLEPNFRGGRKFKAVLQNLWVKLRKRLQARNESKDDYKPIRQDGFISALLFFLVWTACSFSFALGMYISKKQSLGVLPVEVEYSLLINMAIASFLMWSFSAYKKPRFDYMSRYILDKPTEDELTIPPESMSSARSVSQSSGTTLSQSGSVASHFVKRMRGILQSAIPLIGILLFYIAGMAMDIVRSIAHIECLSTFVHHNCTVDVRRYVVSIITHCWRIVYKGSLIVFIFKFHGRAFKQCTAVRYLLLFILASVTIDWFNTLLFESQELFTVKEQNVKTNCTPYPYGNNSFLKAVLRSSRQTNLTNCLNEKTDLFENERSMAPYIYPLHIEFALMVGEILFHLYFSVVNATRHEEKTLSDDRGDEEDLGEGPPRRELEDIAASGGYGAMGFTHKEDDLPERARPYRKPARNTLTTDNEESISIVHEQREVTAEVTPDRSTNVDVMETEITRRRRILEESDKMSWPGESHFENYQGGDAVMEGNQLPVDHLRGFDSDTITEIPCQVSNSITNGLRHRNPAQLPKKEDTNYEGNTYGVGEDSGKEEGRKEQLASGLPVLFAPTVVLSIMLITMALLTNLDNNTKEHNDFTIVNTGNCTTNITLHWRQNYENYKLFYHLFMITTAIFGFIACRKPTSNYYPYNGLEMLIVFISFGQYMHIFLHIISCWKFALGSRVDNISDCRPDIPINFLVITILSKFAWLCQIYSQTVFFLYAGRIKLPKSANLTKRVLKNCLAILAVCNLTWWVADSFAEVQNHDLTPVQAYYYDDEKWHLISHILYPLTLFYRFNCFLLILGVYFEH